MLKAVLFDAGDTLFHVRGSVGSVYATVAARHGVIVGAAETEQRFRAAFRAMPPLAFPDAADATLPRREYAWWKTVVAAAFASIRFDDFEAFFDDLFRHFARAASWELFPDTRPALAALRACGMRLGIVSNFDGRLTEICGGLGIAHFFDAIVMSSRAGYAKPDPRIFAVAVQRLGVTASEVLHVGDSELEDLAGARAAGLQALLIVREGASGLAPDQVRDLRNLISSIPRPIA